MDFSISILSHSDTFSYPEQLLTVGPGTAGSQYLGDWVGINQPLAVTEAGPIVVDTIDRKAYWYNPSTLHISRQSLSPGSPEEVHTYHHNRATDMTRSKVNCYVEFLLTQQIPNFPPPNFPPPQVFLPIPSTHRVLALAFDWIGKFLYILRENVATQRLELHKVLIYDTDRPFNVFQRLEETSQRNATYQLVMNPFTG